MDPTNDDRSTQFTALACPDCGAARVSTSRVQQDFAYGAGPDAVTLTATVPVRHCDACGFQFTDREAEEVRHEAVCLHLGVMSPRQIRQLRELHGYTQAAFAEVTKLGEATISRWERGAVVQNQAYDNYLYLLGFADNLRRLGERTERLAHRAGGPPQARFKVLRLDEALLRRKKDFRLAATS